MKGPRKHQHPEHDLIVRIIEAVLNLAELALLLLPCWRHPKRPRTPKS